MNYLGVDVGGTHCRTEWWPATRGSDAPGVQPAVHGVPAAAAGLARVLQEAAATAPVAAAVVAMAGVGEAAVRAKLVAALREHGLAFPIAVVGDTLAAAAAALREGPGVGVWAGTGSFAVARDRAGQLHRVGGRGYLLGDQGSGYDLVRRAAAAVLLAADDLGPPTALAAALTKAFGAEGPVRLGAVLQRLDTGAVATRLPTVLEVAAAGDPVANEVLAEGVEALAMLASAAVRRAGLDWSGLPVALGGGVLLGVPAVVEPLGERLRALGAGVLTVLDARAPARGAAWLAAGWANGRTPAKEWVDHGAL